MAGEQIITIIGNLTADPEVRYTQAGAAVVSFTVASTPRTFDRQANEWKDGEPLFTRCEAWNDIAENIAESLEKGARVLVQGQLMPNNFTDGEGNERRGTKVRVHEVGPSLRYATARPQKVNRRQQAQQGGYSGQQGQGWGNAPQGGAQPSELGYDQPPPF